MSTRKFLMAFLALPLLAALGAWSANALASPRRRLSWRPVHAVPVPLPATASAAPLRAPAPILTPAPAPEPPPRPEAPKAARPQPVAVAPLSHADQARARFPWDPEHLEREITSAEALEAFQLGIPFFDARRSADFEAGHIRRARSLPVWEDDLAERLQRLAADPAFQPRPSRLRVPLVLYCSGGTCEDSHRLAEQLIPLGFGNLLIYADGFPDWRDRGRPVASGVEAP